MEKRDGSSQQHTFRNTLSRKILFIQTSFPKDPCCLKKLFFPALVFWACLDIVCYSLFSLQKCSWAENLQGKGHVIENALPSAENLTCCRF